MEPEEESSSPTIPPPSLKEQLTLPEVDICDCKNNADTTQRSLYLKNFIIQNQSYIESRMNAMLSPIFPATKQIF
jgi:hypothetical protein